MVFLKSIVQSFPQNDNRFMRHLLIGLLVSYRQHRRSFGFHGQIGQMSIVGVEHSSGALYPNNSRGNIFNQKSMANGAGPGSERGSAEDSLEPFGFRYRLIYHHFHMLTIKEWLDKRMQAQRVKAK